MDKETYVEVKVELREYCGDRATLYTSVHHMKIGGPDALALFPDKENGLEYIRWLLPRVKELLSLPAPDSTGDHVYLGADELRKCLFIRYDKVQEGEE